MYRFYIPTFGGSPRAFYSCLATYIFLLNSKEKYVRNVRLSTCIVGSNMKGKLKLPRVIKFAKFFF